MSKLPCLGTAENKNHESLQEFKKLKSSCGKSWELNLYNKCFIPKLPSRHGYYLEDVPMLYLNLEFYIQGRETILKKCTHCA